MENLDNHTPAQELGTSQSPNPRMPRPARIHSHSYEAQLTSEELEKLHAALLKPGVNVSQLLAKCPPWRVGPMAGRKPRLSTIYKILARLRGEQAVAESSSTAQVLGKAGADCRAASLGQAGRPSGIPHLFSKFPRPVNPCISTLLRDFPTLSDTFFMPCPIDDHFSIAFPRCRAGLVVLGFWGRTTLVHPCPSLSI